MNKLFIGLLLLVIFNIYKNLVYRYKNLKGKNKKKDKKDKKSKHKKHRNCELSEKEIKPNQLIRHRLSNNLISKKNKELLKLSISVNGLNNTNVEVRHMAPKAIDINDSKFDYLKTTTGVNPLANVPVSPPYGPLQIRACYNVKNYSLDGKNAPIVAIVVAYYNPNIQTDFDKWTSNFGLPKKKLNIINMGKNNNIATGSEKGWYLEGCMDVQAVYTISPNSNIYVIFAVSPSFSHILNAINKANQIGASVVSMSFGSTTDNPFLESVFTSKSCCYIASSGDLPQISYPSTSASVLSVGGTTLNVGKNDLNNFIRLNETTWSSAGLGFSTYFKQPAYQNNISILTGKNRATPDICAIANPSTGFLVYCSNYQSGGKWYQVGGTSLSCPLISGLISNANILRKTTGKSSLSTVNSSGFQLQTFLYNIYKNNNPTYSYSNNFYDIVTGKTGAFNAGNGYDIPSSLGVPNFDVLTYSLLNGL